MDKIRCPACRGAKMVAKIGGIMGECNSCSGKGQINAVDKPKPVIVEPSLPIQDIVQQVAKVEPLVIEDKPVKVDPKKAIYKRKTASK